MSQMSDDINYDYVNQKLLYLLLIRGCSVVVRPFEYGYKLDGLFELLRTFYVVEEIDMNKITNPTHLEGFLCQYDDIEKKSILLLKNVTQPTMDEVMKYSDVLFIALEKDQSVDYSQFQKIAVFNKKTKKFSFIVPKSQISVNSLAYKWIRDKIISDLKIKGMLEVKEYLGMIFEKVISLFELLPAISKSLYEYFCSELSSQEQKAIIAICERYYNVNLPNYTKKTIKKKENKEPEILEKSIQDNLEKSDHSHHQKEIKEEEEKKKEPITPPLPEIEPEPQTYNEDQTNEEIWNIINSDNGSSIFNAFSMALSEINIPNNDDFSSPEKKYLYLRANQWKTEVSFEFFKKLFLYYIREEIKSANITKSQIGHYLMDKHEYIVDICSMFASPEFRRMDSSQYTDDEVLRFHIKKEPIVSYILPVEKITKSVPPKEFEKMFSQDINENDKNDFIIRYHEKLEKLKSEYIEAEINPVLINKLKSKTKELETEVSVLFQN